MPALYAEISLKYPDILRSQSTCISYGTHGDNNLAPFHLHWMETILKQKKSHIPWEGL